MHINQILSEEGIFCCLKSVSEIIILALYVSVPGLAVACCLVARSYRIFAVNDIVDVHCAFFGVWGADAAVCVCVCV